MTVGIWRNAAHQCESDWGVIEHTRARPERGEVGHLILVSVTGYHQLIHGPMPEGASMATRSFSGDRAFYCLDYDGQRWTWELFETHWVDEPGSHPVFIGRWPD